VVSVQVVDDEPTLLELIESYLKIEGPTVATAMDGPSAGRDARQLDVMLRCGRMSCHPRTGSAN
jgi:CheY-like chemotaxis protein